MGLADRDYYRSGPASAPRFGAMPWMTVTMWLIVINFAVALIDSILVRWLGVYYVVELPWTQLPFPPLNFWGHFSVALAIFHGQVWRFLTFQFLHAGPGPWHLVVNMLMLYFFGIHRLDRGVYGVPGGPGCVVAAVRVSCGIICLESALYLHGLLPDEPWESWLCIHDKAWKPKQSLVYPVEIVRTTLRFREDEVIRRRDGLLYTSLPRTIVDFHRYRHRIPQPAFHGIVDDRPPEYRHAQRLDLGLRRRG